MDYLKKSIWWILFLLGLNVGLNILQTARLEEIEQAVNDFEPVVIEYVQEVPADIPVTETPTEQAGEPVEVEEICEPTLLGEYRITAYCSCKTCCGKWAENRPNGIVYGAAGVELTAGLSCASPLPFGTTVIVDGLGEYVVQDRTADWVAEKYDGKVIDIYFDDHQEAARFGVKYLNVFEKGENENDHL